MVYHNYSYLTNRVDQRAQDLIAEFRDHFRECEEQGMTDRRRVFEGWVIQKIAGVQAMIELLNEQSLD